MSTRDEIGRNELLEGLDGNMFITDLDDGEQVVINLEHRAAVAAALCPPAPGEVRLTLKHEDVTVLTWLVGMTHPQSDEANEALRRIKAALESAAAPGVGNAAAE
jgi:hypothetical protein